MSTKVHSEQVARMLAKETIDAAVKFNALVNADAKYSEVIAARNTRQ